MSASLPPEVQQIVEQIRADAAQRAGVPASQVSVQRVEERAWSDTSLGCPRPGELYAQVITPGYLVVVQAGGRRYEYHTDAGRRFVLCSS